ncbi:TetR/AcrR family transcriptional regulator [Roseococcus sp. YIM B11640]|uniref:TetR/AcrR family transcriptional regulator n=1 Tax=Roseococcus sp. YIM B11640 TaxID=3133973 RepID=UPI003C7A1C2C
MRISRDKMLENRRAILDAAARLFREQGFEAVTVAAVMQAAGLTHGAFYNHFESKDDLIAKTFAHILLPEPAQDRFAGVVLDDFARGYLSPRHRDDPGEGCVFAALGGEGARCGKAARQVMTEGARRQIERMAQDAPGATPEERRRAAIQRYAAMVGAMVLARAVDDTALSDEVLAATLQGVTA